MRRAFPNKKKKKREKKITWVTCYTYCELNCELSAHHIMSVFNSVKGHAPRLWELTSKAPMSAREANLSRGGRLRIDLPFRQWRLDRELVLEEE